MQRRALLWLAGVALVALALLLTDRLLWQPGLTEDNVCRLRPGMTLAEVEAPPEAPPGAKRRPSGRKIRDRSRCPFPVAHASPRTGRRTEAGVSSVVGNAIGAWAAWTAKPFKAP